MTIAYQEKTMRIGGDFGLDAKFFHASKNELPNFWFPHEFNYFYNTGRSSLLIALKTIVKLKGTKVAWIPRFICSSVISAFKELSYKIYFYDFDSDLGKPFLPEAPNEGDVVLIVHYFGHKCQNFDYWIRNFKNKNFFLIEDCSQALLTENIGKIADFTLNSIRKFSFVPDGSVLSSKFPVKERVSAVSNKFINLKLISKILLTNISQSKMHLEYGEKAEDILDNYLIPRHISLLSKELIQFIDWQMIAKIRINNWHLIHKMIESNVLINKEINFLFYKLTNNEVPLGFPIILESKEIRNDLRNFLKLRNIFCPIHWILTSESEEESSYLSGYSHSLSEAILTLPIDQRMGENELSYLNNCLIDFFKKNSVK